MTLNDRHPASLPNESPRARSEPSKREADPMGDYWATFRELINILRSTNGYDDLTASTLARPKLKRASQDLVLDGQDGDVVIIDLGQAGVFNARPKLIYYL